MRGEGEERTQFHPGRIEYNSQLPNQLPAAIEPEPKLNHGNQHAWEPHFPKRPDSLPFWSSCLSQTRTCCGPVA